MWDMASPVTRHLTILLTDIKGFTDKTSHKTRADIQSMLDEHREVVLPILESGGGKLIKTIGDAFLMTFESPTNAVLAGVAVQEALAKRNEGRAADDRLEIRIAINSGEINLVEGDVFGEPVNITARIEGIAEAGQVYFTEAVYLAMNKAEVPSAEVGLMQLKGIPEKIRVYKVRREDPVGDAASAPERPRHRFFGLIPPPAAPVAAFGPGVKAVPVSSVPSALPSARRRVAAVCIDALLCWTLLGALGGRGPLIHLHKKRASPPNVAMDAKGIKDASAGKNMVLDANGIHADDEDEADDSLLGRVLRGRWNFAIAWFVYGLLFLKWLGSSPGGRLMKLRVVSENGAPLDKRQRMLRAGFSVVSWSVFCLGYLWGLWDPQRRTWHDLVAGTRVVPAE